MTTKALNKSFLYFLPLIYRHVKEELNAELDAGNSSFLSGIENVYVFYNEDNKVVLEFNNFQVYKVVEDILQKSSIFVSNFDLENPIVILDIPDSALQSYDLFIRGKYSKMPVADQKYIVEFLGTFIDKHTIGSSENQLPISMAVGQVFLRDKRRIQAMCEMFGISLSEFKEDWEVSSIINKEVETYYFNENEYNIQEAFANSGSTLPEA